MSQRRNGRDGHGSCEIIRCEIRRERLGSKTLGFDGLVDGFEKGGIGDRRIYNGDVGGA